MPSTRKTTTKKNSKKKNSRKSSTRKTAPKKRSSTKRSSPRTKTIIREIVRTVPQTPRRFSQPQYQAPRHYQPQYQSTPQYAQPSPSYVTSYPAAYPVVNYLSPWNDYYGGISGLAGLGAGIRLLNEATAGRNGRDGRDGRVVRIKEKDVGVGGGPSQIPGSIDRERNRWTDPGTGLVNKTFPGTPGMRSMPDLRQTVAGNTGAPEAGRVMMANPNRFKRASSGTAAGGIGGQANLGANP